MNKSKIFTNSLIGSSIVCLGVGGVVLGSGFDSWEQSIAVEKLSKQTALTQQVISLDEAIASYNKDPLNASKKIDTSFSKLLRIIFTGNSINATDTKPMWVNWNKDLSKLMSNPENKKIYGSLKLNDSYEKLLNFSDSSIEGVAVENAVIAIKGIQPILKELGLVTEGTAGFIIGVTFLSLTAIPLVTLFALSIKNKYFKEKAKE